MTIQAKNSLLCAAAGLISGAINGLLGAGGGILITYFLAFVTRDEDIDQNSIFANALITMLPISAVSFGVYLARGYVKLDTGLLYLVAPAVIGGLMGSFLLKKLKFKFIKLGFCALVIYSGASMLF